MHYYFKGTTLSRWCIVRSLVDSYLEAILNHLRYSIMSQPPTGPQSVVYNSI